MAASKDGRAATGLRPQWGGSNITTVDTAAHCGAIAVVAAIVGGGCFFGVVGVVVVAVVVGKYDTSMMLTEWRYNALLTHR